MARQERPKEDLVRDATAFAVRVEFRRSEDDPNWVFVGLREGGGGTIYFGDDEFYAFNSRNELRRAFLDGRLLKAENCRLVAMRRERSEGESSLATETIADEARATMLTSISRRIADLVQAIDEDERPVVRSAGDSANDRSSIADWLSTMNRGEIVVAERPNAQ